MMDMILLNINSSRRDTKKKNVGLSLKKTCGSFPERSLIVFSKFRLHLLLLIPSDHLANVFLSFFAPLLDKCF